MFRSLHRYGVYATLLVAAAALLIGVGLTRQARAADFDCSTVIDVSQVECEALVDLYNAMHGDEWYDNYGWLDDPEVCYWSGINCSAGHVYMIELGFNGAYGEIPASIGDLTFLEYLNIGGIEGTLPVEISTLTNLTHLDVSGAYPNTQFEGPLPDLSALTQLLDLRIQNSTIGGTIPSWINQTNFPNLVVLHLTSNGFTGAVPSTITSMTDMMVIDLANNSFSGSFPDFSATCDTLKLLWIGSSTNAFEPGLFPAWLNGVDCPNLRQLSLSKSSFTGAFPDLSGMPLEELTLRDNHFDPGPIPAWLVNQTGLEHLDLSNTLREGELPDFASAPTLYDLSLDNNRLTGGIPASYNRTNYPLMDVMNFFSNQLTSIHPNFATFADGPEGAAYVSVYLNLLIPSSLHPDVQAYLDDINSGWRTWQIVPPTVLSVDPTATGAVVTVTPINIINYFWPTYRVEVSTTPGGPYTMAGYTNTMPGTVTPVTITASGLQPDTQYYYIVRTSIFADYGVDPVYNAYTRLSLPSAEQSFTTSEGAEPTFSCANTVQTGIPQAECEALVTFYNTNNGENWTDNDGWLSTSPVWLWQGISVNSGHVSEIWLPHNNMNGPFPDLSALTGLTRLNLSDNHFTSGPVPAWLLDLDGYTELNISNTKRTGEVPSFTNTGSIETLMLSSNLFTGSIPSSYNATTYPNLTNISFFHNQITGIAPEYATFSEDTFTSVWYNAINPLLVDPDVAAYLDIVNDSWRDTQVVPVSSFLLTATGPTTVNVTITNIPLALLPSKTVTYAVMVSETPGGPYTERKQINDNNQATVSDTVTGLTPGTTYYMVIRSSVVNSFGNPAHSLSMASVDSMELTVTTEAVPVGKPSKPTLTLPANNENISGTKSPVLVWQPNPAQEQVTSYKLIVKNDATGKKVLNTTFTASEICTLTCTVDLGALSPVVSLANAKYNWQVTATNMIGNAKSAKSKFTLVKPSKPVATAPVGNATLNTVNPTLTFTIPDQAITTVTVTVKNVSGGTPFKETFDTAAVCVGLDCSVTVTSALGSGSYTWQVQAHNVNGKNKSAKAAFKIVFPDAATDLAPTGKVNVIGQTPTLSWSEVTNAAEYRITIKPKKGKKVVVGWVAPGSEGVSCDAGVCTLDLTQVSTAPLLKKGKQTWFVETRNTALHPTSTAKSAKAKFKVVLP